MSSILLGDGGKTLKKLGAGRTEKEEENGDRERERKRKRERYRMVPPMSPVLGGCGWVGWVDGRTDGRTDGMNLVLASFFKCCQFVDLLLLFLYSWGDLFHAKSS